MAKQPLCRICRKRPPWRDKNCPPDVCKRCYHRHIWPEVRARSEAAGRDLESQHAAAAETRPTVPMVYDGYYGRFVPVEDASFDVATTPEAVVELPRTTATSPRRGRKGGAARRGESLGA